MVLAARSSAGNPTNLCCCPMATTMDSADGRETTSIFQLWTEPPLLIKNPDAARQFECQFMLAVPDDPFRSPAIEDLDPLFHSLFDFRLKSRHLVLFFQADDADVFRAHFAAYESGIDGGVATSNHCDAFPDADGIPLSGLSQEIDSLIDSRQVLSGDTQVCRASAARREQDGIPFTLELLWIEIFSQRKSGSERPPPSSPAFERNN